jgi:hypothetical protein
MMEKERIIKPLGRKAYGSIPHLPGSRLGPADRHCHVGQATIATEKARDKHDIIIVQEKLDGSNVAVARVNGVLHILTRAGYPAISSPYEQHHKFALWAYDNIDRFDELLKEGERICGEWLAQAHGTRYDLKHEPFVAFDIMTGEKRLNYHTFRDRVTKYDFIVPFLVSYGPPVAVKDAMSKMGSGNHGAIDPVEGLMYRIERKGEVDFLTKHVRSDKQDGKYLPEYNNDIITWNIK